jgi:hypothetical protein
MLKSTNTEIIEKKVDVDTALSRMRRPLDLTTVNVEVYGVYSLPEVWRQKITVSRAMLYAAHYSLQK